MSWNYRIIDHRTHFALHEVFYNEAGEVRAWSAEPAGFVSCWIEGAGGMAEALDRALHSARNLPVLALADLPGG